MISKFDILLRLDEIFDADSILRSLRESIENCREDNEELYFYSMLIARAEIYDEDF